MYLINLAFKSLVNRKYTVMLTVMAIMLSVTLLLFVERVRTDAKESFANTISGTDLIVGSRSGSIQLLLYSVFRIGNPTNNISWESYQEIINSPLVKWSIPISLGDSHKGYRVMGTNDDYFTYYRYGQKREIHFQQGKKFNHIYDAVIGSEVAEKLGYELGDEIVIMHGAGKVGFIDHGDKPFTISGIIKSTGTPIDKTIHVSLEAIEAIHVGWENGVPSGQQVALTQTQLENLTPEVITGFFVGLKSRISTFKMQRQINEYRQEPLLAILPGIALQELWGLMGVAEKALFIISVFVIMIGLVGMLTMILSSLSERRREMAILRSAGAKPRHIIGLLTSEATLLALFGVILGVVLFYAMLWIFSPVLESEFGIILSMSMLSTYELSILSVVVISATIMGGIPAYRAYLNSISDGISVRL